MASEKPELGSAADRAGVLAAEVVESVVIGYLG